jgi:hypothetical protein
MALLLRRRHADRPRRRHRRHGRRHGRPRAPAPGPAPGYRDFQKISAHLHDVSERFFFWKPVEDLFDTIDCRANLNPSTLKDVLSLRMGSSVAGTIRSKVKDDRLAQMLDHFTQYVGSSPYGSPRCSAPSPTCRRRTGCGIPWAAPARWRKPW